jgi:hypothetical protein
MSWLAGLIKHISCIRKNDEDPVSDTPMLNIMDSFKTIFKKEIWKKYEVKKKINRGI